MTPRYGGRPGDGVLLAQVGEYDIYFNWPYYKLRWGRREFQNARYHMDELHEHADGHPGIKAWIAFGGKDDAHKRLPRRQTE